jgi:hypothetical protein
MSFKQDIIAIGELLTEGAKKNRDKEYSRPGWPSGFGAVQPSPNPTPYEKDLQLIFNAYAEITARSDEFLKTHANWNYAEFLAYMEPYYKKADEIRDMVATKHKTDLGGPHT